MDVTYKGKIEFSVWKQETERDGWWRSTKLRRLVIAFPLCFVGAQSMASENNEAITVKVGPGSEVTITVPYINRENLREVVTSFFSNGDEKAKADLDSAFGKASAITLVLTTKHGGDHAEKAKTRP